MGIDLGGHNRLVTQHLLNGTEVGSTIDQMGCKGVTQGVGANDLSYANRLCRDLYNVKDRDAGEVVTEAVEEDIVLTMRGYGKFVAAPEIGFDKLFGLGTDGNQTLLLTFAKNLNIVLVEMEIAHLEVGKFRNAESAAIESLYDGTVAETIDLINIKRGLHRVDFLNGENGGNLAPDLGSLNRLCWVSLQLFLQNKVFEERANSAKHTSLSARAYAILSQPYDETAKVVDCNLLGGEVSKLVLIEVVHEFEQVIIISLNGVWGESTFEAKIFHKRVNLFNPIHCVLLTII